jgi:hypothetical protein
MTATIRTRDNLVALTEVRTYQIKGRLHPDADFVPDLTLSVADDRTADLISRTLHGALTAGFNIERTRATVFAALLREYADASGSEYRDRAFLADVDRALGLFAPQPELAGVR